MSFQLVRVGKDPEFADGRRDWPLQPRSPAMTSGALDRLKRDIRAYCRGEIAGRSYLIAGHRGVGKTTLALRAIEDVRYELLQPAAGATAATPGPRRLGVQRPLLVKLHGPSLLEPMAAPEDDDKGKGKKKDKKKKAAEPAAEAGTEAPKADAETPKTSAAAHSVLTQIAVALYRQLAGEAALGFGLKARIENADTTAVADEIAAQLVLDLDSGTDPATLRSYWQRVRRLREGVLWPRWADGLPDTRPAPGVQGLKEILALATAGQAFRVCTGRVTQAMDDTRKRSRKEETKASLSPDVKEMVGRLGALGAGALAGGALLTENAYAAVTGGVLVWLLGSASLSWSFASSRQRDQVDRYAFLPDKTVTTLDRDLPVVIQRVREAGLSPIFVIDELDKVKASADTIADIIGRLKHIIADFGFFCFLTDRAYFDYVEERLHASAYPTEHTYFTERLLLAYGPGDFRTHLDEVLQFEGQAGPDEQDAHDLLTLHLIHKSRLNFADLNRELGRLEDEGVLASSTETILNHDELRLTATVQLAIDGILRDQADRIAEDPGFAQLLTDTLYRVSRAWQDDEAVYDASRAALLEVVRKRVAEAASQSIRDKVLGALSPADETLLVEAHAELVRKLEDFTRIQAEMSASGDTQLVRRSSLIASNPDAPGLLAQKAGTDNCYTFNFTSLGHPRVGARAPLDGDEATALVAMLTAFDGLRTLLGASYADLRTARLLPATLPLTELETARSTLNRWLTGPLPMAEARRSYDAARVLRGLLDDLGPKLSVGLQIARVLSLGAEGRASPAQVFAALGRYPILGEPTRDPAWSVEGWLNDYPSFRLRVTDRPFKGDAATIQDFQSLLPTSATASTVDAGGVWRAWQDRLRRFVEGSPPAIREFGFADLRAAALNEGPGALFPADLAAMTLLDWSRAAVAALGTTQGAGPPRWVLAAILRVLRFNREALEQVVQGPDAWGRPPSTDDLELARPFIDGAERERRSVLVVVDNVDDLDPNAAILDRGPALLYLPRSLADETDVGLRWLTSLGVLNFKVDDGSPQ